MAFKLLQNIAICQSRTVENKQLTTNFIIISICSNWSSALIIFVTNHSILTRILRIIIYIYTLCVCNCATMIKCITIIQLQFLNTSINNIERCIIKINIFITDLLITFEFIALYSNVSMYRRKMKWIQMKEAKLIEIYLKFMTIRFIIMFDNNDGYQMQSDMDEKQTKFIKINVCLNAFGTYTYGIDTAIHNTKQDSNSN